MQQFALLLASALSAGTAVPLPTAPSPSADWTGYNGGPDATRFSPLTQITPANVAGLRRAFVCQLDETTGMQASPVVAGGAIYVTTGDDTYAFSAASGRRLWKTHYDSKANALAQNLGNPVRGVAWDGRNVYRVINNGHVLALDAKTGAIVWDALVGDTTKGEYLNAAAVTTGGRVYVGTAGSDIASIGRIVALDARSGKTIWNFDVVPKTGRGADSWPKGNPRAGGGIYASFAIDEGNGTLVSPTGNPGPDFLPQNRKGDNLYTCGVLKLDLKTGAFRGFYQLVPNDFHDWDLASVPALIRTRGGREAIAASGKDGLLHLVDRRTMKAYARTPFTTRFNVEAPITKAGTRFAPGTSGGANYNGAAFSPLTNLVYIPAVDQPSTVKITDEEPAFVPGKIWTGTEDFGVYDPDTGHLVAIDADSGKEVWRAESPRALIAGVTPTAGGVVFTGDLLGHALAYDAATGKELWRDDTGLSVGGGVSVYGLGGKEYVALSVGMKSNIWKDLKSGPAQVVVYALP